MILYCPAHIEFLLWCHVRAEAFPNRELPMYQELIKELVKEDVIIMAYGDGNEGRYVTTPKGQAWVELLCSTPSPKQAFVDEHGNIIKSKYP